MTPRTESFAVSLSTALADDLVELPAAEQINRLTENAC
jgi:hypothetical protein